MRHLYPRHDRRRIDTAEERDTRANSRGPRRESLPLHRLRGDLPRHPESERRGDHVKSPVSQIAIERPHSLDAALELLHTESLVPIAGATDLYVGLNFGTLKTKRFVDIT